MVSSVMRQCILFTPSLLTPLVSFHLSQFGGSANFLLHLDLDQAVYRLNSGSSLMAANFLGFFGKKKEEAPLQQASPQVITANVSAVPPASAAPKPF